MAEITPWYEISRYNLLNDLRVLQVISRTEKMITVRSRDWSTKSQFHDRRILITADMFLTKEEAHAEILNRLERRIESCEDALQESNKQLEKFKEKLHAENTA